MKRLNNNLHDQSGVDSVQEFLDFLMGISLPDQMSIGRGHAPRLTLKKASTVIWFLREHFALIPDHIEVCSFCNTVFNSDSEGAYVEKTGKHHCEGCIDDTCYQDDPNY